MARSVSGAIAILVCRALFLIPRPAYFDPASESRNERAQKEKSPTMNGQAIDLAKPTNGADVPA